MIVVAAALLVLAIVAFVAACEWWDRSVRR